MNRRTFLAVVFILASPLAAAEEAPDALIKRLADEVTAAIRADKALQAGDARKLAALVEAKIVPHFDFRRATQAVVGAAWRQASPEQRERLVQEFRTLVLRTYSGALASYRDQAIEVRPLRAKPTESEVTVVSRIRQSGAEPIVIEYDLARDAAGGWKAFDIRVAGISLVATYRSAFAEQVRNHGIDSLIESLAAKNRVRA